MQNRKNTQKYFIPAMKHIYTLLHSHCSENFLDNMINLDVLRSILNCIILSKIHCQCLLKHSTEKRKERGDILKLFVANQFNEVICFSNFLESFCLKVVIIKVNTICSNC